MLLFSAYLGEKPTHARGVGHRLDIGMRHMSELGKLRLQTRIEMNECSQVAHAVAVVRGREHRDCFAFMLNKIAFFLDFVTTYQKVQIIAFQECLRDIWPKRETYSSFRRRLARKWLGITP